MKKSTLLRQGDVLLVRVASIPATAKRRDEPAGNPILAHGEVTGHHHRVEHGGAALLDVPAGVYLDLPGDALLTHQEHDPIPLTRGAYQVIRQREYSPAAVRNVAD